MEAAALVAEVVAAALPCLIFDILYKIMHGNTKGNSLVSDVWHTVEAYELL